MKRKETTWLPEERLIVTSLSGDPDSNDIEEWYQTLKNAIAEIKDHSRFKIMVNLYGFKASNFEAHKKFRVIIPQTLANYGWYVGYLRLFPETRLTIRSLRDIHCIAAAHVHHDESKISLYHAKYTMANEGFFTDPETARAWINNIKTN
jgi:hypothetical protein